MDALRHKKNGAAALAVISKELPAADHPISQAAAQLENLRVTSHCTLIPSFP